MVKLRKTIEVDKMHKLAKLVQLIKTVKTLKRFNWTNAQTSWIGSTG